MFHDPLSPLRALGSALETVGTPVVPINTMVMAASLYKLGKSSQEEESTKSSTKTINEHEIDNNNNGDNESDGDEEKRSESSDKQVERTNNKSSSLFSSIRSYLQNNFDSYFPFLLFISIRLLMVPCIVYLIVRMILSSYPTLFQDKLPLMVLLIQSGSPSAQVIMVSISRLGLFDIASSLAPLYFAQYLFCTLTMVLWCSLAINIVYV